MENISEIDKINTSTWSNIPSCLVKAINILSEQAKNSQKELEILKSSSLDSTSTFTAKIARHESSLQEITTSFTSFSTWTASELSSLKAKTEENNVNSEKKYKISSESLNEVKGKYTNFYTEFRKEIRDLVNKFEAQKKITENALYDNFENSKTICQVNGNSLMKKIQISSDEFEKKVNEKLEVVKSLEGVCQEIKGVSIGHEKGLVGNIENFKCLSLEITEIKRKVQENQKLVAEAMKRIDGLSLSPIPLEVIETSPNSPDLLEPPRQESLIFSPIFEKISVLEVSLKNLDSHYSNELKTIERSHQIDLISLKNTMENFSLNQISNTLNDKLAKISSKLEWLPDKFDDIKGMSVSEARIFILESRIRSEEKARILSNKKLMSELSEIKGFASTKSSNNKRLIFSPGETKIINIEFDSHRHKQAKTRPSSSIYRREVLSEEKFQEKLYAKPIGQSTYNFPG